ncbi:MAG: energy-coupling factor transporter ATPase [Coriobacteriales bacterium]|nr:energy-coupling factor transporter ATPase [Coriobacteriales bacterium]
MGSADRTCACASLSHVTLRYDNGTQALEDLSLEVRQGEHLCVLGANGSGKSTLASVLCGLLAPDEGTVTLLGEEVFDSSRVNPIDFAAYRRARRRLGLVFQNPDDQIVTTVVEEDVAFGPENLGVTSHEIGVRVERELRRVAMQEYAKANPTRLSGGQKQRVAIAGALAMEPEVLVLDEPGSLLDVRGRNAIMRVMGRLRNAGTTIVHITHFMEEALAADRVVVLSHGCVMLEGTPQEVFSHASHIARLGLEEPFVARLSQRLNLPWTCDREELVACLVDAGLRPGQKDPAQPDQDDTHDRAADEKNGTRQAREVVVADRVSFAYQRERKALDGVSVRVYDGESVAIVGQTGSGKSTLLRLICALEVPDEGSVVVGGIGTAKRRDRRRLHGTIGYVMQHPERQLFAETVLEDVAFGPTNLGLSTQEISRRCLHALDLVGLKGLNHLSPFELSGGQQRLCAIAGVLAMEPKLLVLDEPTAGLDPRGRRELRALLDDLHEHGITTVQVTHAMEDAVCCDRVVVLDQARVMLEGTPREVFCTNNATALEQAGLGLPAALSFALELQTAGMRGLGDPLTLDALADTLEEVVTHHGA